MGHGPCSSRNCKCPVFTYLNESGCDTCGHSFYSHMDFSPTDDGEMFMAFERHHNTTVLGLLRSIHRLDVDGHVFPETKVKVGCGCKAYPINAVDKSASPRVLRLRLNNNKIARFGLDVVNCAMI